MSLSTLTSKGQITIPKSLRESTSIDAGDKVEFIINEQNEVVIKPILNRIKNVGWARFIADNAICWNHYVQNS